MNRRNASDDEGSPQKKRGTKKELDESLTAHPGLRSVVENLTTVYYILSG
jgi:hypothetical protein